MIVELFQINGASVSVNSNLVLYLEPGDQVSFNGALRDTTLLVMRGGRSFVIEESPAIVRDLLNGEDPRELSRGRR